ncbi:MAG: PspA/IM30 family protein, partial [Pseudomonadota bacterium]
MAEGLVNRVKRLVSGGLGSIVDAIEGGAPETVMKEAIREIDAALDEVRDDLGLVLADKHNATRRIADANARHEELSEKTRLALAEGREDLAEAAIARQIDIEAQMPVLEDALNEAGHRAAELEGYVAALSARRREMEDDLAAFLASRAA